MSVERNKKGHSNRYRVVASRGHMNATDLSIFQGLFAHAKSQILNKSNEFRSEQLTEKKTYF